jgi:hypothetical protein
VNWIKYDVLSLYEVSVENVLFLCSDNTNTMPATARLLRCPFIGCRARRLALFVRHYIGEIDEDDDDEPVHFISKVKKLMKKLRTTS